MTKVSKIKIFVALLVLILLSIYLILFVKKDLRILIYNKSEKDILERVVIKVQGKTFELNNINNGKEITLDLNLSTDSDLKVEIDGELAFNGLYLTNGMSGVIEVLIISKNNVQVKSNVFP